MIRTTHVGSLPRSAAVTALLFARESGEQVDPAKFDRVVADAVAEVVVRQVDAGIDIISDGEMSKISYATYIKDRVTGFDGDSPRRVPQDLEAFPTFLDRQARSGGTPAYRRPRCVGPVSSKTLEPLHDDMRRFAAARANAGNPAGFMNAASPGVIALFQPNDFYPDEDSYLEALAEAMRPEYETIAAGGLVLQLDSPDLGLGRHMMFKGQSDEDYLARVEQHIAVLNHALRNIAAEQVRMHVCGGNYEGPHHCDVEMRLLLPLLVKAKPQGLLFETANPRHGHDVEAFADLKQTIPEDKVMIPGVIDTTSNFIEHPRVVARRLEAFVDLFGTERVIAGTDCGFSTFAGFGAVDAEIVYAKLGTLVEGAAMVGRGLAA